jgi:penicillin-binding protein 1A
LSDGQGANMALPIMAIFLKKVYSDPKFGIMEADEFERPSNFNMELDCEKIKKNSSKGEYSRINKY